MATAATTMVIALARGETLPQDRVEFATRLVIRASTAPPRAHGLTEFRRPYRSGRRCQSVKTSLAVASA